MSYYEVASTATQAIQAILQARFAKYPHDPWPTRTDAEDVDHAIAHLLAYAEGNHDEPHLKHAITRLALMLARQHLKEKHHATPSKYHFAILLVVNEQARKESNMNVIHETQAITPPYQLHTPRDAAKLLAISERHLYTLTHRGDIAAVRMGRAIRYSSAELAAFVSKQMNPVNPSNNT